MSGESKALNTSALKRWRKDPTRFIEEVLRDPDTGRPFQLCPAESASSNTPSRPTMQAGWSTPSLVATPKKTGKTEFAAMHLMTTTLLFGGQFGEAYCVANDLEQAQGRVFQP